MVCSHIYYLYTYYCLVQILSSILKKKKKLKGLIYDFIYTKLVEHSICTQKHRYGYLNPFTAGIKKKILYSIINFHSERLSIWFFNPFNPLLP